MENYKIVYPMFIKLFLDLEKNALETDSVNDIYYHLKRFLNVAFEKCYRNTDYCEKWLKWFKNRSTILLRDLFSEIKCNYFENLINGNAIDTLDSLNFKL